MRWIAIGAFVVLLIVSAGPRLLGAALLNRTMREYLQARLHDETARSVDRERRVMAEIRQAAEWYVPSATRDRLAFMEARHAGQPPAFGTGCSAGNEPWLIIGALNDARAWVRRGHADEAERLYSWANAACPRSFDIVVDWAELRKQQKRLPEALALLDAAAALTPAIPPSDHIEETEDWWRRLRLAGLHQQRGDILLELDRPGEAARALEEARAMSPRPVSASALQLLGIAYFRADRPREAAEAFRAALHLQPDLQDARSYLAQIDRHK